MSDLPRFDPDAIDPLEVARLIKQVPRDDLEALMASEVRRQILDEIFDRMERHVRSDRAAGIDAVVHWKILDHPDGGYDLYEAVLRDGTCIVARCETRPHADPTLTLRVKPVDFLRLVTGNADGRMLALRGRLRVSGDIALAMRLGALFDVP